ncbi:MAG: hypothetical protein O7F16_03405 [Acidobacteria bacterium]|jgi:tetratricopeptide (TPR) repeat protein|nr:hypothetical protein [Acidobacteriota bacterium]
MPAAVKRKSATASRSRAKAKSTRGKTKIKAKAKAEPKPRQKRSLTEEQQKAYREFEHAVSFVYKKDYAKGKAELETLAQKRAEDRDLLDRIRIYLNVCKTRLGGTPRPESIDPYMRALVQYNEGEYAEAISLLGKAPKSGAGWSSVLYLNACAHLANGAREEGLKLLSEAVQVDTDNRYRALNDPDLEEIRTDDDFLDALGDEEIGA